MLPVSSNLSFHERQQRYKDSIASSLERLNHWYNGRRQQFLEVEEHQFFKLVVEEIERDPFDFLTEGKIIPYIHRLLTSGLIHFKYYSYGRAEEDAMVEKIEAWALDNRERIHRHALKHNEAYSDCMDYMNRVRSRGLFNKNL